MVRTTAGAALGAFGLSLFAVGGAGAEERSLAAAVLDGKPIFELRPRVEGVDQAGLKAATAYTMRTRVGWETKSWRGIAATLEIENVSAVGPQEYNSGLNGKTTYAGIGDPDVTELNVLQLTAKPVDDLKATVGRQKITIDDQRFVGESNARQDATRFDAARLDWAKGSFSATYAYVAKADRAAAEKGDWDTDAHYLQVSTASHGVKVSGFALAADIDEPGTPALRSSMTVGTRLTAERKAAGLLWSGVLTGAHQTDYGGNPNNFALDFYAGEVEAARGRASVRIIYDVQEGDGANLFATPFGSGHNRHGWSDAFNVAGAKTTRDGLTDANVRFVLKPAKKGDALSRVGVQLIAYDFEAERTSADLGSEFDADVAFVATPRLTISARWADYDGPDVASAPADRTKAWLTLEYKL